MDFHHEDKVFQLSSKLFTIKTSESSIQLYLQLSPGSQEKLTNEISQQ